MTEHENRREENRRRQNHIASLEGINMSPFYEDIEDTFDCYCGYRPGEKLVKDSAGVECCNIDLKTIELRTDIAGPKDVVGHTFLSTPAGTVGYYPLTSKVKPHSYPTAAGATEGVAMDDSTRPFIPKRTISYRLCPKSLKKLYNSIAAHGRGKFHAGNLPARNCVGWACQRLEDAGVPSGSPEGAVTPWARPHDLPGKVAPREN